MTRTRCPYFNCTNTNVKKNGRRNGVQRYVCLHCGGTWQSKRRPDRFVASLWRSYAWEGQTVNTLAKRHELSPGTIRTLLGEYTPTPLIHRPRTVAVIMDATYFGDWGILVVIDPYADAIGGENLVLYHRVLKGTERTVDYEIALDTLEALGYSVIMATIDGRRGVKEMLEERAIPVQYCHFHQLMTVTQCLTKRPKLPQNKALRAIALTLAHTDELSLEDALARWYATHSTWLKERYTDPQTGRVRYRHARTRRAYFSLVNHLPHLFTYQNDYMQQYAKETGKRLANTTSPLDGRFGVWKDRLIPHRGASKQRIFTMLCSFFSERID